MKIVPYESPHDDDTVSVDTVTVTYTQSCYCTESTGLIQTITLSTRNNGMARFIHVQTEGWSISSPDEMTAILANFQIRAGLIGGI